MKKKSLSNLLLFFLVLFCSCSNKTSPDLRFAFIGDLHYKIPDYRTADYLIPPIAGEFDSLKLKPEFVILTGDFFHGGRGTDIENESKFAFGNFSENLNIPFFIARGNHDTRDYFERNALPLFSKELGIDMKKSYFSFNKSNCHFIMLDCNEEDLTSQLSWLEKDLESAKSDPETEHIFVAGHFPLWIIARAGFTRPEYASAVAALLAKYGVDAYFCGHTHNKTLTVRLINGQPLTQIMDAGVVEEGRLFNLAPFLRNINKASENEDRPGLLALEEAHQIFIPPSGLKYYWGYQEGSTTSYYVITVNGKSVQADWHVLGQGIIRSVKWDQPGYLTDLLSPEKTNRDLLQESDLDHITDAWIYAAPWISEDSVLVPFSINGVSAGNLDINRIKMAASPFWNKIEVPLNETSIAALKMENEISISNPGDYKFGLAHMFLLVKFRDGQFAKSTVSPKVITSFIANGEYPNFPDAELIDAVNSGEPLSKVTLRFDRLYNK